MPPADLHVKASSDGTWSIHSVQDGPLPGVFADASAAFRVAAGAVQAAGDIVVHDLDHHCHVCHVGEPHGTETGP